MSILCSMLGASFTSAAPTETSKAVQFESANSERYFSNSITRTSITQNKTVTVSFWWRPVTAASFTVMFGSMNAVNNGQNALFLSQTASGQFRFYTYGNGNVQVDASTTNAVYSNNTWTHVVLSYDSASTSTRYCYVNGVSTAMTYSTYRTDLNSGLYDIGTIGIGARNNYNTFDFQSNGNMSQLWIDNSYTDLSVTANRQRFYNSGWVAMGTDGTGSGLSRPLIYHNGDTSTSPAFSSNQGRTGTNSISYTLSVNGTISDVAGP